MAILDLSSLTGPTAPSGTERGTRLLTDVLDAIAQRRQQKQIADQQLAAQQAQQDAAMQFNQQKLEQDARFKQQDDERAEQIRQDQAAQMKAQRELKEREDMAAALKESFSMAREPGGAANVPAYLGLRGIKVAPPEAPPAEPVPEDPAAFAPQDDPMHGIQPMQSLPQPARPKAPEGVLEMQGPGGIKSQLNLQPLTPEARRQALLAILPPDSPDRAALERIADTEGAGAFKPGAAGMALQSSAEGRLGREAAKERAHITAARRDEMSAGEKARNAMAKVGAFNTEQERWQGQQKVDKLQEAYSAWRTGSDNISSYKRDKDIVALRSALYQTARTITGPGVLTAQEYSNTVSATAGWTEELKTKIQKGLSGGISDAEYAAMEKFIAHAGKALRKRAAEKVRNFDKRFQGSPNYPPEEVSAAREALAQGFGLSSTDLEASAAGKDNADHVADKFLKRKAGAK